MDTLTQLATDLEVFARRMDPVVAERVCEKAIPVSNVEERPAPRVSRSRYFFRNFTPQRSRTWLGSRPYCFVRKRESTQTNSTHY